MNPNDSLPEWLKTEQNYEPSGDKDGFITQTALQLMSVLSRVRTSGVHGRQRVSAPMKLVLTFLLILLLACARNLYFAGFVLAGVLVRLMLLDGKRLLSVLRAALGAMLFSVLLLLPAAFLGSPASMVTISGKVFLSVALVNLLALTTPWNALTESLRFFHVPDVFIFTFDITLKYIVLLGEVCLHMLQALRLRSVGKNTRKHQSLSGVLGVTFLKSRAMADEMYQAMVCRGFEGEYRSLKKYRFFPGDLAVIVLIISVLALFFYLEGAIR